MSERPPYVQQRKLADNAVAYYWHVPKGRRPDITVRALPLGTDADAAFAVARRLHLGCDPRRKGPLRAELEHRTTLARRFAALDALSCQRALREAESEELEQVMIDLGMIEP